VSFWTLLVAAGARWRLSVIDEYRIGLAMIGLS
jgi:hypothetical protein